MATFHTSGENDKAFESNTTTVGSTKSDGNTTVIKPPVSYYSTELGLPTEDRIKVLEAKVDALEEVIFDLIKILRKKEEE